MTKSRMVAAVAAVALTVAACVDEAKPTPEPTATADAVVSAEPTLPVATPVPAEAASSPGADG